MKIIKNICMVDIYKVNLAIEYLSSYLDINLNNERERYLLLRAIKYAGIGNYDPNPIDLYVSACSDIFLAIAESVFRCSLLDRLKDIQEIKAIKNDEYQKIHEIKLRLPMNGRFLNYKQ